MGRVICSQSLFQREQHWSVGGKLKSQSFVFTESEGDELVEPGCVQHACRNSSRKAFPEAGQDWQSGTQSILCRSMRIIGQGIEKEVGNTKTVEMSDAIWNKASKDQPFRTNIARSRF